MTLLYTKDSGGFVDWSSGSTALLTEREENGINLIISVKCSFGDSADNYYALFDTGAEWAVVPQSIVDGNPENFISLDTPIKLSTRFGLKQGTLHECSVSILVDSGDDIIFDATVLVIPDWDGPVVLGFKTLLNKIRWACDPTIDQQGRLYFGLT